MKAIKNVPKFAGNLAKFSPTSFQQAHFTTN